MKKKKILIIVYSHISKDPRVSKQVSVLKDDYEVHTAGVSGLLGIKHYPIKYKLKFSLWRKIKRLFYHLTGNYEEIYWDNGKKQFLEKSNFGYYDLIIANDISALPLAFKIAHSDTKIYFDAHEYHPRQFENSLKWKLLHQKLIIYLCEKYLPKVDLFTTVGNNIAKEYYKEFGITSGIVYNTSNYKDLPIIENVGYPIRFIHQGVAATSRQLELMINVFKKLDKNKFELNLMLVGDLKYIEKLEKISENISNINFLSPVEYSSLAKFINKFDLGIYLLKPINFNYLNALPNKIFEFIQARLGVVISPNPEMKELVCKYKLGVVSKDYTVDSMIETISKITRDDVLKYKRASDKAAYMLSSNTDMEKIKNNVIKLIG